MLIHIKWQNRVIHQLELQPDLVYLPKVELDQHKLFDDQQFKTLEPLNTHEFSIVVL